jgi:hypothetical protein
MITGILLGHPERLAQVTGGHDALRSDKIQDSLSDCFHVDIVTGNA